MLLTLVRWTMTKVEVMTMTARGKKKPRVKRKMLYPMSSARLQSGAQLDEGFLRRSRDTSYSGIMTEMDWT